MQSGTGPFRANADLKRLGPDLWESAGDDPQFVWRRPFRRGRYLLRVDAQVEGHRQESPLKVYFAPRGGWFSEQNCRTYDGLTDGPRLLRIDLPEGARAIRIDPLEGPGRVRVRDLRIVPEGRPLQSWENRLLRLLDPFLPGAWLDRFGKPGPEKDTPADLPVEDGPVARAPRPGAQAPVVAVEQVVPAPIHLPNVLPLNLRFVAGKTARPYLNMLIPGMALNHMSGGPNTAINLGYRLARRGVPVRFLSTCAPVDADREGLWDHIHKLTDIPERFPHVEIVDAFDRSRTVELGDRDVFFGTAWWTVQMIKDAIRTARSRRFLYLIQEFEPGMYAWSSVYALAQETYGLDFHAIVNESLVLDYLTAGKNGRFADPEFARASLAFEPAVDTAHFHSGELGRREGPRRLLFYGRPNAPRNLYELGIWALRQAVERGAFPADRWELLSMGERVPTVDLGRGVRIRPAPWLGYEEYAAQMRRSDVGLSLMLSPHTSYPPLEMAASGMSVVTNEFANKRGGPLERISANIRAVEPAPDTITEGLLWAFRRTEDIGARRAASRLGLPSRWEDVFEPMLDAVIARIDDCIAQGG